ncbi:MAG: hypothetical protein NTZ25_01185 [Candidatus Peregrinibacteria bacterium]|nr:hypothetical protein [Candidatus Peregrinibacteria bacterium]
MNENTAFLRHEDDIVAKAKHFQIPGYDWEDIAQELRIALWRKLPKFLAKKASERTFADRIMRSRIIDLNRTANRQKRFLDNNHLSYEDLAEKEFYLKDDFNNQTYE